MTGGRRVWLRQAVSRTARNPMAVWVAFGVAHVWLGILNLFAGGYPLGDVTMVYRFWADQVLIGHYWVGIDGGWVYPIVAIFPMLAATAFGPAFYAGTWLGMITALDAFALAVILGWGRKGGNVTAGWWWLGFLVLLGPIALGRIDSVSVPLAIIGVLLVAARPRAAAVILTVATWIKVWPAALLAALLIAVRARWRIFVTAAVTSALISGAALVFGSGANLVSFVGEQTTRGLQVEAPVSTIWLWQAYAGVPGVYPYYDNALLTWQIAGNGVALTGSLMTLLMGLAAGAIVLLALLVVQRGASAERVLAPLTLALVSVLIAFNKVGSPQFMTWLAVPVILGIAMHAAGRGQSFRTPALLVMLMAVLTQAFYPYLYGWLLSLNPTMLLVLTARNGLVFVLAGWAVRALWRAGAPGRWPHGEDSAKVEEAEPTN